MPRKKIRPPLSAAQLEIMEVVWERGESAVSDVWSEIAARRTVARNTVLTVMDRLEKRGWLSKRSVGNTHLYQATSTRQITLGDVVRRFIDSTFGGSADALVMTLLDGGGVTPEEARRIRKRIDEAGKQSR